MFPALGGGSASMCALGAMHTVLAALIIFNTALRFANCVSIKVVEQINEQDSGVIPVFEPREKLFNAQRPFRSIRADEHINLERSDGRVLRRHDAAAGKFALIG